MLAVPHNIFSSNGEGPNQLIKLGASLVTSADDILQTIGIDSTIKTKATQAKASSKLQQDIVNLLQKSPKHLDEIIDLLNIDTSQVSSEIMLMEIKGLIRHIGGNRYASQI